MDIPIGDAIKHIPFILLGIWPVNLLTLWVQGHAWGWDKTPEAIMGLWEWGAFVSFSLAILVELGVEMFIALARHRRRMEREQEQAERERAEAREEGRKEAQKEARREANEMLLVLNAAARTNPDLLPGLLQEYQKKYQNGSTTA